MKVIMDRTRRDLFDGKATVSEVTLVFGPPECPPIHLLLVTPNRTNPAPVFVCLNFLGNQAVLRDPDIHLSQHWLANGPGVVSNRMTASGRGAEADAWNVEHTIERGYAFATFHTADIQEDRTNAVNGVRELHPECDWGNIAAWAWGISRAIDYLETNPAIDAKRIAVFGHSRNGKAALLAAALDERIALVIPHQAGCGGTAPSRHDIGPAAGGSNKVETIRAINDRFPHWFNAEFKKYSDAPESLPMDQHELMALVAPRSLLISVAAGDTWSNPAGQLAMERAAEPVWRLFGLPGVEFGQLPQTRTLSTRPMGFYFRPGSHSTTAEDWSAFLDYADARFK